MSDNKKDTIFGIHVASSVKFTDDKLSAMQKEITYLQKENEKLLENATSFENELELICVELANIQDSIQAIRRTIEKIS